MRDTGRQDVGETLDLANRGSQVGKPGNIHYYSSLDRNILLISRVLQRMSHFSGAKSVGPHCFLSTLPRVHNLLFSVAPQDVPLVADDFLDLVLHSPLNLLVHGEDPDGPAEQHRLRLGAHHEHLAQDGAQVVLRERAVAPYSNGVFKWYQLRSNILSHFYVLLMHLPPHHSMQWLFEYRSCRHRP